MDAAICHSTCANKALSEAEEQQKKSGFLLQSRSRRQMDAPIISARSGLYLQFLLLLCTPPALAYCGQNAKEAA